MKNKKVLSFVIVLSLILVLMINSKSDATNVYDYNEHINFSITNKEDKVKVKIYPKIETKKELLDYTKVSKDSFKKLQNQKNEFDLIATVTLNKPIAVNEFEKVINMYSIDLVSFTIRALDSEGTRITIGGVPDLDSKRISQEKINSFITEDMDLKGIIAFECKMNNKNIKEIDNLQKNKNIFLVDVESYFIEQQVSGKNKGKKIQGDTVPNMYWFLEDFKLTE
ncbi:hypothetical protein [Clostridium grantii]|uniref:Uncharacterized protein n=1 Tax=Clostridium grantii DSM 8605 TaxID=1121316 RepID=A0A1M5V5I8_9CLOT|nr:hypothetical protein [Clostridium grantii]SHH70505.1 hypothetical protein SAMN02745207_02098 [Clostridium grantii DSM 8605]